MKTRFSIPFLGFRAKISLFGLFLVAVVGLPATLLALWQPWREVYDVIDDTRLLLKTVEPAILESDLRMMNDFALEMAERLHGEDTESGSVDRNIACEQAFNMLLEERRLLSKVEALAAMAEVDWDGAVADHDALANCYEFWTAELDQRPGLQDRFTRYRDLLASAQLAAKESGLAVESIYLTVDRGASAGGYFAENIAFVVDGSPWWDSVYPGEPYNLVENETLDWRASYDPAAGGQPGFYHNRVVDPDNYYLPDLDQDEWGSWFTSWLATSRLDGAGLPIYSAINVDIEASSILSTMLGTGLGVLAALMLLSILILRLTGGLSRRLSEPIAALTAGAEAVMEQRYDHVVPNFGRGEFQRLGQVFNTMIGWVGERVNLHETLIKLLGEELTDEAAQSGLVLGGQRVECTIMYTDFAGFSSLTPLMRPEETVRLLNVYFAELVPVIMDHGGFPDKYIGDAIVAIFGAPVQLKDHALRAARCAVAMQAAMRGLNEVRRAKREPVFEMRIGLDTGEVVAGAIGCDLKMEYTSIGEATNLANRMESRCPIGHALISENTQVRIGRADTGALAILPTEGREIVKGYPDGVRAFALIMHDRLIRRPERAESAVSFYRYQSASPALIVATMGSDESSPA